MDGVFRPFREPAKIDMGKPFGAVTIKEPLLGRLFRAINTQ